MQKAYCVLLVVACWMVLPGLAAHAADANKNHIDEDSGLWAPISLKFPIVHKFSGYAEWQPRWQMETRKNFTESQFRTGLGYDFNRSVSFFAGYFINLYSLPELNAEHRAWEQLQVSHFLGKMKVQHRFRLEESWRQQWSGASCRIRDQIKLAYPFGKTCWYATASDEPFFNLNSPKDGPKQGLAQNRLLLESVAKLDVVPALNADI